MNNHFSSIDNKFIPIQNQIKEEKIIASKKNQILSKATTTKLKRANIFQTKKSSNY